MKIKRRNHIFRYKQENQTGLREHSVPTSPAKKAFSVLLTLEHFEHAQPGQACICGISVGVMDQKDTLALGYVPYSAETNGSRLYLGCKINAKGVISKLESFVVPTTAQKILRIFDDKTKTLAQRLELIKKFFKNEKGLLIRFAPSGNKPGQGNPNRLRPNKRLPDGDPKKHVKSRGAAARLIAAGLLGDKDVTMTGTGL